MEQPTRQLIRRIGAVLMATYLGWVAILALLKAGTAFPGIPWAEVVYGPAITTVSIFLLVVLGDWVELKIRGRANPGGPVDRGPDRHQRPDA